MILEIKTQRIKENASQLPKRYFGKHFSHGIAGYAQEGVVSFISNDTAKAMDNSFEGKPLFVMHNSKYNLEELETIADGYVVKSFFNPADGYHWSEFMVVSDKGHKAVADGWGLSNAYRVIESGPAGVWQGNSYDEEITKAEYHHLAIVPDPRYESVILTPEQFKSYNDTRMAEMVTNSKGDKSMLFNLFKKDNVQNSSVLDGLMVELPKTKRTITIENALKELDEKENTVDYEGTRYNLEEMTEMYKNSMKKNKELEEEITKNKKNESDKEEDKEDKKENKVKKNEDDKDKEDKKGEKENSLHDDLLKQNSSSSENVENGRIYTNSYAEKLGKERYSK